MPPSSLLVDLSVPPEYARYDAISDADTLERLEKWKQTVSRSLSELRDLVQREEHKQSSIGDQAHLVAAVAAFDGDGPWITDSSKQLSREILSSFSPPSHPLLEHILLYQLKPVFQPTPHPYLNLSTGRKLPRPAGGPMATQDYYEVQPWKAHPGAANLVAWCVHNSETSTYEAFWHLLIPPVMTLLDDYEVPYKLCGVYITSSLLEAAPPDLLTRTGVDALLLSSLSTALTFLSSPHTPALLRAALPALLRLAQRTTTAGSAARFSRLCALLGDGIIAHVWSYASQDPQAVAAATESLPAILEEMGIGCVRYLKAIVPQLVHALDVPYVQADRALQLASAHSLAVVVRVGAPCMHRWKDLVLDGVARCWVGLADTGTNREDMHELREALVEVCMELAKACPSVVQSEYARLLSLDAEMFAGLLGQ